MGYSGGGHRIPSPYSAAMLRRSVSIMQAGRQLVDMGGGYRRADDFGGSAACGRSHGARGRACLPAVRRAYYGLKTAQEKVKVLGETAQLFSGTFSAAQTRLKAGDLAPADVAKVQVDFERAQNDARGARGDLVRAQTALAYMIGLEREAGELRAIE